jgi:DNA (cytosine-5)-methyltransferase 1
MVDAVTVCGTGLGLRVYRHRLFESNLPLVGTDCDHSRPAMNPHNQAGRDAMYEEFGRCDPEPRWRQEMGVPWMSRYDAREAIPPAYTEHIGRQLIAQLDAAEVAA